MLPLFKIEAAKFYVAGVPKILANINFGEPPLELLKI
jgi:hypothetical protein